MHERGAGMSLPIVFVHKGASPYLPYALHQARAYNPGARVVLLGDAAACSMARPEERVPLSRYMEGADAFASTYKNLSTNPVGFELFCFQRWFALRDWMHAEGVDRAVYLDTDVLCYTDLGAESDRLQAASMTVVQGVGPGSNFIHDIRILDSFCDFMTAMYTDHLAEYEGVYAEYQTRGVPGGICDMWAFNEFAAAHPRHVTDLFHVVDGALYDTHMLTPSGFQMDGEIKAITFEGDRPYGVREADGARIRFHVLHFAGGSKRFIFRYVTRATGAVRLRVLMDRTRFFFARLRHAASKRLLRKA